MKFHRVLGMLVLIGFIYFYVQLEVLSPNLYQAINYQHPKVVQGAFFIMMFPIFTMIVFLNPFNFLEKITPRTNVLGSYVLSPTIGYIVGYVSFFVFLFLVYVFNDYQ